MLELSLTLPFRCCSPRFPRKNRTLSPFIRNNRFIPNNCIRHLVFRTGQLIFRRKWNFSPHFAQAPPWPLAPLPHSLRVDPISAKKQSTDGDNKHSARDENFRKTAEINPVAWPERSLLEAGWWTMWRNRGGVAGVGTHNRQLGWVRKRGQGKFPA